MKLELSQVIDRPPAEVFRFIATNHVLNHPRWDPKMELLNGGSVGMRSPVLSAPAPSRWKGLGSKVARGR